MNDEFKLRELMADDAKIYRIRNQIAEKTDPASKKAKGRKKAEAPPVTETIPTEEPQR